MQNETSHISVAHNAYRAQVCGLNRDDLILEHLEFVRHILSKVVVQLPSDVDRENLESSGILGLVEAAKQFEPERGVSFKTFAYNRIRGAILDELRRNSPLPQKVIQNISAIRKVCETLPPPHSPEAIVENTDLTMEDVETALEAMRLSRFQNWEDPASFNGGILDPRTMQPDVAASFTEMKHAPADAITRLPENERVVVTLYHLEDMRLKEIGNVLGLSESRISRILAKAEQRLRIYIGPDNSL